MRNSRNNVDRLAGSAAVFAALGDETRLRLVSQLSGGRSYSIAQLTHGSRITRQAVTKHLHVLERAGVVRRARRGRESHFAYNPRAFDGVENYLAFVSRQWDEALGRLKTLVEK